MADNQKIQKSQRGYLLPELKGLDARVGRFNIMILQYDLGQPL